MVSANRVAQLEEQAKLVRKTLLTSIYQAQSGHPGGSFSAADLVTALYFDELRLDPQNPKWDLRDRFILSKGHVCPLLYTCLAMRGFFPMETLSTLRNFGSILQGHPDMKRCPGIDISTGSLGQGLSAGVGMALRAKRDHLDYRVFVLVGDGESQEGQIWEAVETAVKYKLNNLIIILDHNGIQNDGFCEDVMPVGKLADKMRAFGCETVSIDGHNMREILTAFENIRNCDTPAPRCIVASTVKGKGVSFMENVPAWHGKAPNEAEYLQAIAEIEEGLK